MTGAPRKGHSCQLNAPRLVHRVPPVEPDSDELLRKVFPSHKANISAARKAVRETLNRHPEITTDVDLIELLVSELATNAVLHSSSPTFTVLLERCPDQDLRVSVTDLGGTAKVPTLCDYNEQSEGGRGLSLVAEQAKDWGVRPLGRGHQVWFEIAA